MKTRYSQFVPPFVMGLALFIITWIGLFSCKIPDAIHCSDPSYPHWCPSAKKCCGSNFPYNDGHGNCYQTMSGCTSSGYQCEDCSGGSTGGSTGSNKYDGTYNWEIKYCGQHPSCFDCVYIKNGQISNSGGTFYGAISVDNFGNITFRGKCPMNSAPCTDATFTGKMGGATYYAWSGSWVCNTGCGNGPCSGDYWSLVQHH